MVIRALLYEVIDGFIGTRFYSEVRDKGVGVLA